jgi:hypothetical protein
MRKIKQLLLVFFLFAGMMAIVPQSSKAAPPDPDCDPLDPACPVDGGVSILIATGIGLGIKRARRKKAQDKM